MTTAPRIVLFDRWASVSQRPSARCVANWLSIAMPNLDLATSAKATTTVGADYGVIRLAEGQNCTSMAAPGQERFSFMREWLMSFAVGAIVLVDLADSEATGSAVSLLTGGRIVTGPAGCRGRGGASASESQIQTFAQSLSSNVDMAVRFSRPTCDRGQNARCPLSSSFNQRELEEPVEDENFG